MVKCDWYIWGQGESEGMDLDGMSLEDIDSMSGVLSEEQRASAKAR